MRRCFNQVCTRVGRRGYAEENEKSRKGERSKTSERPKVILQYFVHRKCHLRSLFLDGHLHFKAYFKVYLLCNSIDLMFISPVLCKVTCLSGYYLEKKLVALQTRASRHDCMSTETTSIPLEDNYFSDRSECF